MLLNPLEVKKSSLTKFDFRFRFRREVKSGLTSAHTNLTSAFAYFLSFTSSNSTSVTFSAEPLDDEPEEPALPELAPASAPG